VSDLPLLIEQLSEATKAGPHKLCSLSPSLCPCSTVCLSTHPFSHSSLSWESQALWLCYRCTDLDLSLLTGKMHLTPVVTSTREGSDQGCMGGLPCGKNNLPSQLCGLWPVSGGNTMGHRCTRVGQEGEERLPQVYTLIGQPCCSVLEQ
jgi:hypothetical protein